MGHLEATAVAGTTADMCRSDEFSRENLGGQYFQLAFLDLLHAYRIYLWIVMLMSLAEDLWEDPGHKFAAPFTWVGAATDQCCTC